MSLLCESTLSPHHFNDQPTGWAARHRQKAPSQRSVLHHLHFPRGPKNLERRSKWRPLQKCWRRTEEGELLLVDEWGFVKKPKISVPSTAETAFLILSVTHYLERAAIFRTFTWTLQVTQIPRHSTVKSGDLDFKIPYIWVLLYETNNSRLEVRFVRKITESRCISILFWSVRLQRCKWHLACRTRGE